MISFGEIKNLKNGLSATRLLRKYNIQTHFCYYDEDLKKHFPPDSENVTLVTDSIMSSYWNDISFYKKAFIYKIKDESLSEVEKALKGNAGVKKVVGFGGGRVMDVAKMLAFRTGSELILVPTAPTHDGLMSKNAALLNGGKKSYPTKFADIVIIPEGMWTYSGRLKNAGKLDILGNMIALQDVSLALTRGKMKVENAYLEMSLYSVKTILENGDYHSFTKSLFLSGLAMEKSSRYCSGSEHELEKILTPKTGNGYLHGQLVGTGALLAAKVYEAYSSELPSGLFIEPEKIFETFAKVIRKKGLFDYAAEPLRKNGVRASWLKKASSVRPERYTLWNEIDSRRVDWENIIKGVLDAG